jgi:hypothetical protein
MANVREKLSGTEEQSNLAEQCEEINDYIMRTLYADFFSVEMPSVAEYNLQ